MQTLKIFKNKGFILNRKRSGFTGLGQATIEYLILFSIIAALTYLGVSKFGDIARSLANYQTKAEEKISG